MTKYITITKNGLIAFLLSFILVFIFAGLTRAESNSNNNDNNGNNNNEGENVQEPAQKYGITFPIVELGNCDSLAACRQYCDDSNNLTACIDFSKKKGFYKQPKSQTEIMVLAKVELGCDSVDSCRTFCGDQANWLKCGEFAKKHNLGGKEGADNGDSKKAALLQKAKTFLGCDSYDSCKAFCQQPQNHPKCEELFRMVHQGENEHQSTPAATPDRSFCQNLTQKMGSASAETIKAYYLKYCVPPGYHQGSFSPPLSPYPKPSYDPAAKCQSYPGCSWKDNNRCECTNTTITKEEYCRRYPDHCGLTPSSSGNSNIGTSVLGVSSVKTFFQTLLDWFK